jgi:hypothetical protein
MPKKSTLLLAGNKEAQIKAPNNLNVPIIPNPVSTNKL